MLLKSTSILRFIYGKNKDKKPLRMRMDAFADGGTHISNHKPATTVHMYIALHLRQKQRQKRHCACVWTGLQMVGHIYRTTSLPRRSTCILRFIYGNKQGQNAIAHAYGRVCRWWDTYIEPQACQDGPHVYCASFNAINKDKTRRF